MTEPAYVSIAGEYAQRIRSGQLPPGTQLPSYAEIAEQYGVSDIVVRGVIELLHSQDLVRRVRRRGIFVADRPTPQASIDAATLVGDLAAEGEPEKEFNPGIAGRLPRKNVAAGALIRDATNRTLFVVPTYKPSLEIPGGLAKENESPRAACDREIHEELGLRITLGSVLVVDWTPTHGVWRDSLQFIYDGGVLSADQIARIDLNADELSDMRFLALEDALSLLRPSMARRISLALGALTEGQPVYAEFGHRM